MLEMASLLSGLSPTLDTVYWACLFIGAAIGIISFVVGDIAHLSFDHGDFGPLSAPVIAGFLVLFGGGGLVGRFADAGPETTAVCALLSGVVGSSAIYFVMAKLVIKQAGGTTYEPKDWVGHEAEVITEVPAEGVGEITFDTESGRVSAPARSSNAVRIGNGRIVMIEKHVAGTFIVRDPNAKPAESPISSNTSETTA